MSSTGRLVITTEATQNLLYQQQKHIIEKNNGYDQILGKYYREPYYFYMNFFLREGRMPESHETHGRSVLYESDVIKLIKELDNIFTQIKPIDIPVVVYRGIPLSDISDYNTSLQYQSTTFDLARASSATTPKLCCIFSITIPVGIKAIITNNSQQEVILNRNVGVVVNDKNPLSYVNMKAVFASSAISTDFQSVENFIKNQQDIYKDTKKTKQTIIDNHKRSDIDKIIQDLYEKISLEDDIDPEDFSAKLGISTDQMEKLIDDIKENEMDENEIKDAITKL